jgi:hypothetical protein
MVNSRTHYERLGITLPGGPWRSAEAFPKRWCQAPFGNPGVAAFARTRVVPRAAFAKTRVTRVMRVNSYSPALWRVRLQARLVRVVQRTNQGDVTREVNYTYDVFERRIGKRIDWDGRRPALAEERRFV